MHNSLVASSGHYQNIVNPVYTNVGIGVIDVGGGAVYVVENFVRPKGTGASAPAAAPPTTARRALAAPPHRPDRPPPARVPAPAARAQGSMPAPAAAAPAPPRPQPPSPALTFVVEGVRAIDLTFEH